MMTLLNGDDCLQQIRDCAGIKLYYLSDFEHLNELFSIYKVK